MDILKKYERFISEKEIERINSVFQDKEKQQEAAFELIKTRMANEYNYKLIHIGEGKYKTQSDTII